MRTILSLIFTLFLIEACSTKAPRDPGKASPPKSPKIVGASEGSGISFDARQLANEMESNYVTEILFPKGSAKLSEPAKNSLRHLMKQAGKEGFLKKAKLITWADKEMPTEKKESLSRDEVALAKKRNDALTVFIQSSHGKVEVDPLSMAERSEGLRKIFPDERARIQESLDEAGIPENGEKNKALSKASRSIIIFTR